MEHRTVEEHLTGLQAAVDAFVAAAQAVDLGARVPTCPSWTVGALLAHQGMVHRWARATLLGEECHPPDWNAEGRRAADPVAWFVVGAQELVATIGAAPDDTRAMVFLKDAPPPRVFWARRQCHETTIHAVDAVAARLRRFPEPADARWIDQATALDGIDELLTGFVTRGTARFAGVGPRDFVVRPERTTRGWLVRVRADGAVETTRTDGREETDGGAGPWAGGSGTAVRGSAQALYLALWNRLAAGSVDDPAWVLTVWGERARVRWS